MNKWLELTLFLGAFFMLLMLVSAIPDDYFDDR